MTALLCFARPLILLVVSSRAQSLINDRKLVMSLGHKAAVTHGPRDRGIRDGNLETIKTALKQKAGNSVWLSDSIN